MAAINGEIVFKSGEYRPCIVKTTDERALFHRWVEEAGMTIALVEFEDGHVAKVNPRSILFLDSPYIFAEICWGTEENNDKEYRENEELKRFVHENL